VTRTRLPLLSSSTDAQRRALEKFSWFASVVLLLAGGCRNGTGAHHLSGLPLRYHNAHYALEFSLPASWQGYSVLTQQWEGQSYIPARDELMVTEQGPIIVLRQPGWRDDQPSQDVPLLVFTRGQWEAMQNGKFSVGAGGVWQEIMCNSSFVFVISSRFNANDSLKGWAEATDAVERNRAAHAPHLNEL
jgi:hypothetical protein